MYDIYIELEIAGVEFELGVDYTYTAGTSDWNDEEGTDAELTVNHIVILLDVDKHNSSVPNDIMFMMQDDRFRVSVEDEIKDKLEREND